MSNARKKILTAATECFFQHGYSAANISMIARYAEISRVTIHKQFKSKEALFRAVIEKYIADNNQLLSVYINANGDFWSETESFILARCGGLFKEISSALIRADLLHAGQSYCQDIIQQDQLKIRDGIKYRVAKEIAAKQLTLERINMSTAELSRLIVSAPLAPALSSLEEDNQAFIRHIMRVFKASTSM